MSSGTPQASGTIGAVNDLISVDVLGMGSVGFQVSGTWSGTLVFEGLIDGAPTSLSLTPPGGGTSVSSTTTNGIWVGSVAGLRLAWVRCSAYTSGSAAVVIQAETGAVSGLTGGTARIGAVYDTGGTILDEVPTVRTVGRAFVNASASGNTQLIAAQGGAVRIRVLAVVGVVGGTAVSVKFQSATTDVSALFACAANGGFVLPYNPHGWFQTAANEALNVNLSGAVATGVQTIWAQAA